MRLVVVCLLLMGCAASHPQKLADADPVLTMVLASLGLLPTDVTIRGDILDDADRPEVVRRLLAHPLDSDLVTQAFHGQTAMAILTSAARFNGWDVTQRGDEAVVDVPETVPVVLRNLVSELIHCRREVDAVFSSFSEPEKLDDLFLLVNPEIEKNESEQDAWIALGRRVDRDGLCRASVRLLRAVDAFLTEDVVLSPLRLETPFGWVIVGTIGDDVYDEPALLIVDPGGQDRYVGVAGVAGALLPVSVCLDLGGNDTYVVKQAVGQQGIGVVIDVAGNDQYDCDWPGQGGGIAGVGVLEDRQGEDVYRGALGCQGVGVYGVGVLMDRAGADHYEGAFLVQGAAGPGGVGVLADLAGNDVYVSGGRVPDFREAGSFQCMAQGFALGIRPLTSGGVGVLMDGAGDDEYRADYFAQGAAFWGGAGFLIDQAGSDQYNARRYAQGAGVHLAVGVLQDQAGDDVYSVWGVGQGCGHDLAVGILHDFKGADTYHATWLSQGAGNANGIGILDDGAGSDRYVAEREDAQGYGNASRDYGSIGLLMDRSGRDVYEGRGGDGRLWGGGSYGGGIDWPVIEKGQQVGAKGAPMQP